MSRITENLIPLVSTVIDSPTTDREQLGCLCDILWLAYKQRHSCPTIRPPSEGVGDPFDSDDLAFLRSQWLRLENLLKGE